MNAAELAAIEARIETEGPLSTYAFDTKVMGKQDMWSRAHTNWHWIICGIAASCRLRVGRDSTLVGRGRWPGSASLGKKRSARDRID